MAPGRILAKPSVAVAVLAAALLAVLGGPIEAQSECQLRLAAAEESYLAGHFDKALELLEPCWHGRVGRSQRAAAYALAAKAHIADDDLERAAAAIRGLILLEPDFVPGFRDPAPFSEMVAEVRRASAAVMVTSVSKIAEPLREAPATVVVVTAEEIERRGYHDLEQVLHDLPGFDVSRGNGDVYSNVYQRGFRSGANDRMLLLVDGVEQNPPTSGGADLSRQYPLSNVERIEVVYGPASAMYGANASTGAIHVITRSPEAFLEDGETLGGRVIASSGSFDTRYVDVTLAGATRGGTLSWSLTGRTYRSDEMDLSRFAEWDYDPAFYDTIDYSGSFETSDSDEAFFFSLSPFFDVVFDDARGLYVVSVNAAGAELARRLDKDALGLALGGGPIGFSDDTDDWSVDGKLQTGNLLLGIQSWRREEGSAPWYTDQSRPGSRNGSVWAPRQSLVYLRYTHPVAEDVALTFFGQFKDHAIGGDSVATELRNFSGSGEGDLSVFDFVNLFDQACIPYVSHWARIGKRESSSQFRGELRLAYDPSPRLSAVGGLELRSSSTQIDFLTATELAFPPVDPCFGSPPAFVLSFETGQHVRHRDLGLFAQVSYRFGDRLKAIAGGRIERGDASNVEDTRGEPLRAEGFGTVFTPRLALVYTPGDVVLKAIYSEAFRVPTNFELFSTTGVRGVPSPFLGTEKVRSFELSAGWQPTRALALDLTAYETRYRDLVDLGKQRDDVFVHNPFFEAGTTAQFQNVGSLRVRGAHVTATLAYKRHDFSANYTYADPVSTDPRDTDPESAGFGGPLRDGFGDPIAELPAGDVARHRVNLGWNVRFQDHWNLNLRVNYVGSRRTGEGTAVFHNPLSEIDSYTVAHLALAYEDLLVPGLDLQFVVNNLFDEEYFHPGVRLANGEQYASRLPQPERALSLRLLYRPQRHGGFQETSRQAPKPSPGERDAVAAGAPGLEPAVATPSVESPLPARSACESRLVEAEESYLAGRIDEVFDLLGPCWRGRITKPQKAAAHALAAKAHLANDDLEAAAAAVRSLILLEPDFAPGLRDGAAFARIVADVQRESATVTVASVSKSAEPLREAPATVVVVTAEEIERRGYHDLEQLLHDLPGFDVSRGNGDVYSNVYQRGFRSKTTDRTLLLIDGVEQNQLMSNVAYLSRQYPLSNVDRVEVVYGPASTMYGANAYTGVINVLTRAPEDFLAEGENFGGRVIAAAGSFDTNYLDFTLAGRTRNATLSWSLTGRTYRSDEMDLSRFEEWDYDPAFYDSFDYDGLLGFTTADAFEVLQFSASPYFDVTFDEARGLYVVSVNEAGAERARALDQAALALALGDRPLGFSDDSDDRFLYGKLRAGNLHLGFQSWQNEEGSTPWYTDQARPGSRNGSAWTPRQSLVHLQYSRPLGSDLTWTFFGQYKDHEIAGGSVTTDLLSYAGGSFLGSFDPAVIFEPPAFGDVPRWERVGLRESSSQFRGELRLLYSPSPRLDAVGGLELRTSSVQLDFLRSGFALVPDPFGLDDFVEFAGGQQLRHEDLGLFAQASYRLGERLKVVAGGRVDRGEVGNVNVVDGEHFGVSAEGYGTIFTPRLALVYTAADVVLKAIYSEAFKDPTDFERFSTTATREVPSPLLETERVRNLELSAGWQGSSGLAIETAVYEARYSNLVEVGRQRRDLYYDAPVILPGTTEQFQNLGSLRVRGAQVTASLRLERHELFSNYTYTDPVSLDPRDTDSESPGFGGPLLDGSGNPIAELPVGDIARHRLNLGWNVRLHDHWNLNLRANYVGSRRTGPGTTVGRNPLAEIEAYAVVHAAVAYEDLLTPGLDLQLVVDNLLDEEYFHPGVQSADGVRFAARLPQPERAVFLRLLYKM